MKKFMMKMSWLKLNFPDNSIDSIKFVLRMYDLFWEFRADKITKDKMYISVQNKCKYYHNNKIIGPYWLSTGVFSRLRLSGNWLNSRFPLTPRDSLAFCTILGAPLLTTLGRIILPRLSPSEVKLTSYPETSPWLIFQRNSTMYLSRLVSCEKRCNSSSFSQ